MISIKSKKFRNKGHFFCASGHFFYAWNVLYALTVYLFDLAKEAR